MAMLDPGPWGTAQSLYNRNVSLDRRLAGKLNELSEEQANAEKIVTAIEAGSVYGLRQQRYDMRLKKQLNRQWRHPEVQAMW
jgi:hypothetical protein